MPSRLLAVLLTLCVLGTAGACSSDDEKDPAPTEVAVPPPVALVPAADEEQVREEVRKAVRVTGLPETLLPPLPFVARDNSLMPRDQSCVLGYLSVERYEPCWVGDPTADRVVALWGDAHAAQWIPALDMLGQAHGIAVDVRTKYGCPPLAGTPVWLPAEDRAYTECAEFTARTLDHLAESDPDAVLLAGALRGTVLAVDGLPVPLGRVVGENGWRLEPARDGLWQDGLARSLEALDAAGTRAVVLGDTPYPAHDAQGCLQRHPENARACTARRDAATHPRHDAASAGTARRAGAEHVSTVDWFCTRRTCPPVVDDIVVYRDGFSVGRPYAAYLSTVLGRAAGLLG